MENKTQFRSAGFGGFNRQDVLSYIEQTARETTQQLEALQTQCNEGQEREDELNRQVLERNSQLAALQEEFGALTKERDGLLSRLKKLEPLQLQVPLLQSQLDRVTPDAEAYSNLKNQISDIELESRRRASEIVEQAQKEAEEIASTAQSTAQQQLTAAKESAKKQLNNASRDAATQVSAAQKRAEKLMAEANQKAAVLAQQAEQKVIAEQARVKNLRAQLQSSYEATRNNVQDAVACSLNDVEQMHDALVRLQKTFSETKKLLQDPVPKEKASE